MSIAILLEMPVSMDPDKEAIVDGDLRLTLGQVDALVDQGAARIAESGARCVAYVGTGGAAMPVLLFASARAGVPFAPLNYRLTTDALLELIRACFQYSNNSTESSSPTFSDKIRFIEGYCLHRRPLYLNRYFQGVVDELRHDLETREARLMMQRYDGTYIHEGIESFLLRHLK